MTSSGSKYPSPCLREHFPIVYGVELKERADTPRTFAVGSYRLRGTISMIPQMTQVALRIHEKDMVKEYPDFNKKKFLYRLSMSEYGRRVGKGLHEARFRDTPYSELFFASFLRLDPSSPLIF